MKTKTYTAEVKAADTDAGSFEAIVSVFGNVDLVGDRIVKGAFAKSLDDWKASGDPIPVVFSHQWDDLDAHIGKVIDAEERDEGLWVKAQLDLDDPAGAKVHRMLKDRRIREFSFAYDVVDERSADDGANELTELTIIEVGPTLKGANPATQLLEVKAALAAKAGRVVSAKNEARLNQAVAQIREAAEIIETVLAEAETSGTSAGAGDGGKATPTTTPQDTDGVTGQESDARSHPTTGDLRLQVDLARVVV